jgi:hypothetical protein
MKRFFDTAILIILKKFKSFANCTTKLRRPLAQIPDGEGKFRSIKRDLSKLPGGIIPGYIIESLKRGGCRGYTPLLCSRTVTRKRLGIMSVLGSGKRH